MGSAQSLRYFVFQRRTLETGKGNIRLLFPPASEYCSEMFAADASYNHFVRTYPDQEIFLVVYTRNNKTGVITPEILQQNQPEDGESQKWLRWFAKNMLSSYY